jgi:CHASE3 domain sensor protein
MRRASSSSKLAGNAFLSRAGLVARRPSRKSRPDLRIGSDSDRKFLELNMSQRSKLAAIITTTGAVMIASLLLILFIGRAAINGNADLVRYHTVIGGLQETLSTLKDAETGQRGYLLTGEDKYLAPYDQAIVSIHREFETLQAEARGGELSEQDVARLGQLTTQKLAELRQTITLRRNQGLPAALAVVQTDFGRNTMNSIRAQVAKMMGAEDAAMAAAKQRAAQLVYLSNLIIALSTLLNLAVLLWAYRQIKSESAAREKAALEIREQKELLDVTLASIGDAVIVTDAQGRITFFNSVAEELTGWTSFEAQRQPCEEVFNIINESSREQSKTPWKKCCVWAS